jgi:hypothetical protein
MPGRKPTFDYVGHTKELIVKQAAAKASPHAAGRAKRTVVEMAVLFAALLLIVVGARYYQAHWLGTDGLFHVIKQPDC